MTGRIRKGSSPVPRSVAELRSPHAYSSGTAPQNRGWRPGAAPAPLRHSDGVAASTVSSVNGVSVLPYGASPEAIAEARRVISTLVRTPEAREAMRKAKVQLVIVPTSTRMVDLPEFAYHRGKRTFDGRKWDDVRGMGGTLLRDGRLVFAVPEENLAKLPQDPYRGTHSVAAHELGHVIQRVVMTKDDRKELHRAYGDRVKRGAPFSDSYARTNEHEYFAQSVNVFTGTNGSGANGSSWLQQNDPRMFELLRRVIGEPQ